MFRLSTALPLLLSGMLSFAAISLGASSRNRFSQVETDEDRYYLPPSGWLRAFSVGYNEALADLLWVNAIVYFGGAQQRWVKAAKGTEDEQGYDARYTGKYVITVVELDPHFVAAYVAGSRLVLYNQREISRGAVEAAIEILERGASAFPNNGEIWFGLGFLSYYELPPYLDDPEAQKASREQGASLIRRAALMKDAPRYTSLLSTKLLRKEGLADVVVEHIKTLLYKETDPNIAASLEAQLRREISAAAERDVREAKRLREEWAQQMSYVPFDLYLLVAGDQRPTAIEALDPLTFFDGFLAIETEGIAPTGSNAEPVH